MRGVAVRNFLQDIRPYKWAITATLAFFAIASLILTALVMKADPATLASSPIGWFVLAPVANLGEPIGAAAAIALAIFFAPVLTFAAAAYCAAALRTTQAEMRYHRRHA